MHARRRTKNASPGVATSARPSAVPADPSQWSDASKRSVAFTSRREYRDEPYRCLHCQAACVFTAQDQKTAFELRKASINQRRTLCEDCWRHSHRIRTALRGSEEQWKNARTALETDRAFLERWLNLLAELERHGAHRRDTARKNMLSARLAACRPFPE